MRLLISTTTLWVFGLWYLLSLGLEFGVASLEFGLGLGLGLRLELEHSHTDRDTLASSSAILLSRNKFVGHCLPTGCGMCDDLGRGPNWKPGEGMMTSVAIAAKTAEIARINRVRTTK